MQKNLIAVWGMAGSGKTTIAVNLAVLISKSGKDVALISSSDYGEVQTFFNEPIVTQGIQHAAGAVQIGVNQFHKLSKPLSNIYLMTAEYGSNPCVVSSLEAEPAQHIIDAACKLFDYVIMDCAAHKASALSGKAIALASTVIIAQPARVSALAWTEAHQDILTHISSRTIVVRNAWHNDCDYRALESANSMFKSDHMLLLPYEAQAAAAQNAGKPLALNRKKYITSLQKILMEVEKRE